MTDIIPINIRFLAFAFMCFSFIFHSCTEDENDPGNIAIAFTQDTYSAPRGSTIDISFIIQSRNPIHTLTVYIGTEAYGFTGGAERIEESVPFTIPGNTTLYKQFPIEIRVGDSEGNANSKTKSIITVPILEEAPDTYTFLRDGQSSVHYQGQNDRLRQVEEIKAYLQTGDAGGLISAQVLADAYANLNGDGNGFFSFTTSKQLKNKSFAPDLDAGFMSNMFTEMAMASTSGQTASNGMAGLIIRENSGNTILVDQKGREFTQFIEKGLMGTVMLNQIFNTYFSDDRIGDQVENTKLREGTNYTDMEHHWDEAFGYFNPPLDFSSNWPENRENEDRFWSHYSNVIDQHIGTNDKVMQSFLEGRTAIVNNDLIEKNVARDNVANSLDLVAAGTAVHYINATLRSLNNGHTGEVFHTLSEAWAFVNALKYNPDRRLSLAEIEKIKESDFGDDGNFWNVTASGLNRAKSTIVTFYPELENSKDVL